MTQKENKTVKAVESDQSSHSDTSAAVHMRDYNDFVSYVMSQLPPKKRSMISAKYELLQNGKGKMLF